MHNIKLFQLVVKGYFPRALGMDAIDTFLRESTRCNTASTGWRKTIRGPAWRMTARIRSRISVL
jgi:hypothetical protein